MKIVAVEISVEHRRTAATDARKECGRLSMEDYVEDDQPLQPVVEKLTAELLRRYRSLNARKTI
jgi:hypothetical protein